MTKRHLRRWYQVFMMISDQYRALRETAVIGAVSLRTAIGISGKDRAAYLQGLLTNDIQAVGPGTGCYAAWLTPQGRMLTDIHLFESGEMILLDVPSGELSGTLQRLDQFLFSEDVQFADLSAALASVWIHGPAASSILEHVLMDAPGCHAPAEPGDAPAEVRALQAWPEYHNARASFAGAPVVVARVSQLGVPGFCVYLEPGRAAELERALVEAGALAAEPATIEAARIEAGYPLFGVDMTTDTIPLEAGIEGRAISLSKGCYVGQEVIIRVLHRGHGRVAKKLMALRIDGGLPAAGAKILAADKDVGVITSAADSPRFGSIALGYVHRDFASPGTSVAVDTPSGRAAAVVSDRPLA
jgi:folate-binding protein YgfZ